MRPKERIVRILSDEKLLHRLAEEEHERWALWQNYLHGQCVQREDGSLIIPSELVDRWSAQISKCYFDLSETERENDQEQVLRYLQIIIDSVAK